jgi:hypothetical protein
MNICLRGRELLLDLQRSDFLPAWDEEGVRTVVSEMNECVTHLKEIAQDTSDVRALPVPRKIGLAYYRQCLDRNRKYINRYGI